MIVFWTLLAALLALALLGAWRPERFVPTALDRDPRNVRRKAVCEMAVFTAMGLSAFGWLP